MDDHNTNRRTMLLKSGIAITGLLSVSGNAAAFPNKRDPDGDGPQKDRRESRGPPKHAEVPEWVDFDGDRVNMDIRERDWKKADVSELDEIPDTVEKVPYDVMKAALETFNQAVEAGEAEFKEQGRRIDFKDQNGIRGAKLGDRR